MSRRLEPMPKGFVSASGLPSKTTVKRLNEACHFLIDVVRSRRCGCGNCSVCAIEKWLTKYGVLEKPPPDPRKCTCSKELRARAPGYHSSACEMLRSP